MSFAVIKTKFLAAFDRLGEYWLKNSRSKPEPMGMASRVGLSLATITFVIFVGWGLVYLSDQARFVDPQGMNLAGEWEFLNGSSNGFPSAFPQKVKVPAPLQGQLKEELANEFWYRKKISLSKEILKNEEAISLSLGSIKGPHTIWLNREFFHTGGELGLANEILPEYWVKKLRANPAQGLEILVKVKKIANPYPGIVHASEMQIGRTKFLAKQLDDYYFQSAVKPVVPAIFKAALFLIFSALFIFMPKKREYIFFALYCLAGAIADFAIWKFQPYYDNSYLRQKIVFYANATAAALVPFFVFEFLRLQNKIALVGRWWGAWLTAVFAIAQIWIGNQAKLTDLFHTFSSIVPFVIYLPAAMICGAAAIILRFKIGLKNRAQQVGVVAICLFFALAVNSRLIAWGAFNGFIFHTFLSLTILIGIAAAMIVDFKSLDQSFVRANSSLPSMIRKLSAADVKKAVIEFSAITVLIDVVGYTKNLIALNTAERDRYNSAIKEALLFLAAEFGGDKLSDTGDGAVYAWEYSRPEDFFTQLQRALAASEKLVGEQSAKTGIQFRLGMAAGSIRCHYTSPDFSFLGDPINTAARLEASAQPGQILLHESIYDAEYFYGERALDLQSLALGQEMTVEIKGASFRTRPYKQAA